MLAIGWYPHTWGEPRVGWDKLIGGVAIVGYSRDGTDSIYYIGILKEKRWTYR